MRQLIRKSLKKAIEISIICSCAIIMSGCQSKAEKEESFGALAGESSEEIIGEKDSMANQEVLASQNLQSVRISFVTDEYEGGSAISSEYEDYYWTKSKLQGEDIQDAPKEMTVVFGDQTYTGRYGFSTYSLGVLFQTDTYSTEDGTIFEINHDTQELVGIFFMDMDKPREEKVSKSEAVIIAKQFLKTQFHMEETPDWLNYTIDNQVYDGGDSVPYYIIRFYSLIDNIIILEDVNVIIGIDGVVLAFQASKLSSFCAFLNNYSWQEIKDTLEQLTDKDTEAQINLAVVQQLGWSESQIRERKMIIDETGRPALMCFVLGSMQGEDEDGSWTDSELIICIVRQPI
ncbi:MAG: hypothetical protein IJM83_04780 [Firmicutes bacterium]|nr:hypothetical protein [Bacillota bacterium]